MAPKPAMQLIPSGIIHMRDDRKKINWQVEISPFLISKFLITQEFYFSVTNELPSIFKGNQKPVENVSWNEAIAFCNLLSKNQGIEEYYHIDNYNNKIMPNQNSKGYRLPCEAEWEYACKAGQNEPRYGDIDEIAWFKNNSDKRTQDVGKKKPNPWGLYDMLGNVWEWCWDKYDHEVYKEYRIFKGGGWYDEKRGCLATNRRKSHPTFKIDDLGFRIAKNI